MNSLLVDSGFLEISPLGSCVSLFDLVRDISFFIKDREGKYLSVNESMVWRFKAHNKEGLIGKTAIEVWGEELGQAFHEQDMEVMERQRPVRERLMRHSYPGGEAGWCLTSRVPLRDQQRRVIGLVGLSRDLQHDVEEDGDLPQLAKALTWAETHLEEPIRIPDLAERAELSVWQFEQRIQRIYQNTPAQWLAQLRMDQARDLLRHTELSIGEIGARCGYSDHSAFTRQFRQHFGTSPQRWRRQIQEQTA